MGVSFDQCLFCMAASPVTGFGAHGTFDYAGVPDVFATMFKRAIAEGYPACERCAALIRTKVQVGLADRAQDLYTVHLDLDAGEQRRQMGLLVNARLWQQVFWLGLATDSGPVVPLAKPSCRRRALCSSWSSRGTRRVLFHHSQTVSMSTAGGGSTLFLEDRRSAHREKATRAGCWISSAPRRTYMESRCTVSSRLTRSTASSPA
jgi:hypothetical protein